MPDDKPKMRAGDKLLSPRSVAKKMDISVRAVYDLIAEGYFKGGCYYPNGPGRRPVRIYESAVEKHIESFTV
jgi:predicted DNA-binding transcriptional regulator AlpA